MFCDACIDDIKNGPCYDCYRRYCLEQEAEQERKQKMQEEMHNWMKEGF